MLRNKVNKGLLIAALSVSATFSATFSAADSCADLGKRLTFGANGTVTDSSTKLTWSRCNLGQAWKGDSCTGNSAKYSYDQAKAVISASKSAEQGYRLPTLDELMSIISWDCGEPAVYKTWTSIESGFYWTSSAAFGGFQNTVLMTTGDEYPMNQDIEAWVLLVK